MGTNMYAYCQNDPVNMCDSEGMFGEAIHNRATTPEGKGYGTYFWTYQFLLLAGMKDKDLAKSYANTFALANKSVDVNWTTAYWNPSTYAQGWHFNNNIIGGDSRESNYNRSYKRAEEEAKNKNITGVLEELGKGLHALQDQVAHSGPLGDITIPLFTTDDGYVIYGKHFHLKGQYDADVFTIGDANYLAAQAATWRVLKDFVKLCTKYNLLSLTNPTESQLSKIF